VHRDRNSRAFRELLLAALASTACACGAPSVVPASSMLGAAAALEATGVGAATSAELATPPSDPSRGQDAKVVEPAAVAPIRTEPAPPLAIASDWRTISRARFEAELARAVPIDERRAIAPVELAELGRALEVSFAGEIATRAALILARSRDAAAAEVLLEALERRSNAEDDAALLVAAWSAGRTPPKQAGARLAGLVHGQRPHPRFLVRLECAAAAIEIGQTSVLPWLLDVLRLGVTKPAPSVSGASDSPDSPVSTEAHAIAAAELAHAQRRAAGLLARVLDEAPRYVPSASVADRAAEVARIEAALAARARARPRR
jgi:hypothetical protein